MASAQLVGRLASCTGDAAAGLARGQAATASPGEMTIGELVFGVCVSTTASGIAAWSSAEACMLGPSGCGAASCTALLAAPGCLAGGVQASALVQRSCSSVT